MKIPFDAKSAKELRRLKWLLDKTILPKILG